MADLSSVAQAYDNAGVEIAAARAAANKKVVNGQGIAGRTRILTLAKTNMVQAELESVILALQAGGTKGVDDAVTVVGVSCLTESGVFTSGTTDLVQVAVQGTGTLTAGADYRGVTGVTMAVIADFAGLQA